VTDHDEDEPQGWPHEQPPWDRMERAKAEEVSLVGLDGTAIKVRGVESPPANDDRI
jgi:hypothetical protein